MSKSRWGSIGRTRETKNDKVLLALFRRTAGSYRLDYYTSAKHEVLQGVKDPTGPVGIHAGREPGPRGSQARLGGLTKQML
jgi:hypothetical protein